MRAAPVLLRSELYGKPELDVLLQTVHFGHFKVGVDATKRIDHV
jgi:hypothetical protein